MLQRNAATSGGGELGASDEGGGRGERTLDGRGGGVGAGLGGAAAGGAASTVNVCAVCGVCMYRGLLSVHP